MTAIAIFICMLFANWLGYKQGMVTPRDWGDWPRWLWAGEYQSVYYMASIVLSAAVAVVVN